MWSGQPLSVRAWLIAVVATSVAGAAIIALVAGLYSTAEYKARLGANIVATTRAMVQTAELQLDQAISAAENLMGAAALTQEDLKPFRAFAERVRRRTGYFVIVRDAQNGTVLVDTSPSGTELPESWLTAFDRGNVVSPLAHLGTSREYAIAVRPQSNESGTRRILTLIVPASIFQSVMDSQRLPDQWSAVLLDSQWRIVARALDPQRYVGQLGASTFAKSLPAPDTTYEGRVLEGYPTLNARSESKKYGWTVAVAVPQSLITAEIVRVAGATGLAAFALAAFIMLICGWFVFLLSKDVRRMAWMAAQVGNSALKPEGGFHVKELAGTAEAMARTGNELFAYKKELQQKIDEVTCKLETEAEQRRRTEAALTEAHRMEAIGRLTGGIAHDFNNLLMVISGNLQLIQAHPASAKLGEWVKNALQGSNRGAQLVKSLLTFAKRSELEIASVDLNEAIRSFYAVLKGAAGDSNQLVLSLTSSPCHSKLDVAQFQSALLNLVTNARAAMPRGGTITIETDTTTEAAEGPDLVAVIVRDTGTGMSDEVARHAFEPFFTTRATGGGTGLGLAQVHGFVTQVGGRVELESRVGVGTTIRMLFPSASAETQLSRGDPEVIPLPVPSRRVVMIVDDDETVRRTLAACLEQSGYEVVQAEHGPAALAKINSGMPIEIVITDQSMPEGMTGAELALRLSQTHPQIRAAILSAREVPLDGLGIPVLKKPIDIAELNRVIAQMLEKHPFRRLNP